MHLIGIVWSNIGISKELKNKLWNCGQLFTKEHKTIMILLKWQDKRDILLLAIKYSNWNNH